MISGLICIHHGPFVRKIWNIHMWFLDLSVYFMVHLSEWYEICTCDFWIYLYTPWSISKNDMKYTHVISGLICIHHGPFVRMICNIHMWFLDLSVYIIVHLSEWYETYTCDFWTYLYTPWSICKNDMKYTHVISGLIYIHHGPFLRMIWNIHMWFLDLSVYTMVHL